MPPAKSTYSVREFAQLTGVTVRALHHYDRIGLLRARRTAAGYRLYTRADLPTLQQVVFLRFIGVPLRQMRRILSAAPTRLAEHLRAQKIVLRGKQQQLARAISAIEMLESQIGSAAPLQSRVFQQLIEVLHMETTNAQAKEQYDVLVARKKARLRAVSPETLQQLRSEWDAIVVAITAQGWRERSCGSRRARSREALSRGPGQIDGRARSD